MSVRTVLIVDDNATNLELYGELVEMTGHKAVLVDRAALVVEQTKTIQPDLILLDLTLPNSSGTQVISELRADSQCAGIKVMALTALQRDGLMDSLRADGFAGYIAKPCSVETFIQALEWGLGESDPQFRSFGR